MKKLFLALLVLFFAACATQGPIEETSFQPEKLEALAPVPANLFEIRLPAGDSGSINVGWFNNGAPKLDPQTWLSQGFDGVKFVGQGVDVTHLRCTSWDGITVAVIQHQGIVQLENLTLHCGYSQATQFGEQNLAKKLSSKFEARLVNCKVVAQPVPVSDVQAALGQMPEAAQVRFMPQRQQIAEAPRGGAYLSNVQAAPAFQQMAERLAQLPVSQAELAAASVVRPKWLVFGYQCDLVLDRVIFQGREAVEHDVYFHGFASKGALVLDCDFQSAGAEGFKVRSDRNETVAVPGTSIVIRRTKFANWHQDWSWRGGAGIVLQGGASDVFIDKCLFKNGPGTPAIPVNARSHCIEIVAEDNSWGGTFGNGHVWIRASAFKGKSDVDWNNSIIRVARNSGNQMAARSVTIERNGIFGQKTLVILGSIPIGKAVVRDCNTPAIKQALAPLFDTTFESMIPTSSRRVLVSEGWVQ